MNYTKENLGQLPQTSGVYIFKDQSGIIIYIGKAINLRNRVSSYFRKSNLNFKVQKISLNCRSIEIVEVENAFEALILEARLININKPKYNITGKDDKSYLYIQITKDKFPRILLSRKKDGENQLYGPYTSASTTRDILSYLRHIFPFCTQTPPLKKVCFYHHLNLCSPCPAEIEKKKTEEKKVLTNIYLNNIKSIKNILSGKSKIVINRLKKQMIQASKESRFEEAANFRDKINHLSELGKNADFLPDVFLANYESGVERWALEEKKLIEHLSPFIDLPASITSIECYDISNISGKFGSGSMVTFVKGKPDKSKYRQFKISLTSSPNDFAMLGEVLNRRFRHKQWQMPGLIMVDGGRIQLDVLIRALRTNNIKIPAISLAKKFEEIYIPLKKSYHILRLEKSDPALNLVRRIRDEAHRFALKYHHKLRLKYVFDLFHNIRTV